MANPTKIIPLSVIEAMVEIDWAHCFCLYKHLQHPRFLSGSIPCRHYLEETAVSRVRTALGWGEDFDPEPDRILKAALGYLYHMA